MSLKVNFNDTKNHLKVNNDVLTLSLKLYFLSPKIITREDFRTKVIQSKQSYTPKEKNKSKKKLLKVKININTKSLNILSENRRTKSSPKIGKTFTLTHQELSSRL